MRLNRSKWTDPFQSTKLNAVRKIVEYLGKADAMMLELQAQDMREAQALLGQRFERSSENGGCTGELRYHSRGRA